MKNLFLISAAVLVLASCSSLSQTSKVLNVETTAKSCNRAELTVSPTKISYTMVVTKSDRRLGEKKVYEKAVAQALKANGNGDLLVAPQYETLKRKGLIGGAKIKQIVVTGYPASYTKFVPVTPNANCRK